MKIHQYMVDAFTNKVFHGNQAAVCCTEQPLEDDLMQSIAIENNFSETAFLVPKGKDNEVFCYSLRWFTPGGEIDLCGHATLASAFVVKNYLDPEAERVGFDTKSGRLSISFDGKGRIVMDMPAYAPEEIPVTDDMERAFGVRPLQAWLARDLVCLLPSEEDVRSCDPQDADLMKLEGQGVAITAAGKEFDCVSRFFAPKLAVHEDPVTGSVHCALVPIWTKKLGKKEIAAYQASSRGGELACRDEGERILIAGNAVLYAEADLHIG